MNVDAITGKIAIFVDFHILYVKQKSHKLCKIIPQSNQIFDIRLESKQLISVQNSDTTPIKGKMYQISRKTNDFLLIKMQIVIKR